MKLFFKISIESLMRFLKIIAIMLLMLFVYDAKAADERGAISGQVKDDESGRPLVGAHISVEANTHGVHSNSNGEFIIDDLIPGTYNVEVTYLGYATQYYVTQVEANKITRLSINLEMLTVNLNNLTIYEYKNSPIDAVNAIDVAFKNKNSSQEMLGLVPGLFIAQHAGGGKAEQIFIRGFDVDHGTDLNIEVDGVPVNMVSHAHGQGYSDLHFIIPELVRQVKYDKGPHRIDKGNFATAGSVELFTPNRITNNQLSFSAGMNNSWRGFTQLKLFDINKPKNKHFAYAAAEYTYSDGYFDLPQNLNRLNFFVKYIGTYNNSTKLTADFSAFESTWDATGQIPQRAVNSGMISRYGTIDPNEGGTTGLKRININFDHAINKSDFIHSQVYFSQYNFQLISNFTFFLNDPVNGDQIRQKENRNLFGFKSTYTRNTDFLDKPFTLDISGGIRYDNISNSELTRTKNKNETVAAVKLGNINEVNEYLYLNGKIDLRENINISSGVRVDYFQFNYTDQLTPDLPVVKSQAFTVSPKFLLNYYPKENIRLFAKAGIGFHSNDARSILSQSTAISLPKAGGVDFGMIFQPFSPLVIQTGFWLIDLEQELVYVGDEGIVEPSGKTRRKGLDLSFRYTINSWLSADMDLNYAIARYRDEPESFNYVPLAPILTSTGGLTINALGNNLNASLRYRYMADRPANEDNSLVANGYFVCDMQLLWKKKKYQLDLMINNIFNTYWKETQFDTTSRLFDEEEAVSEIHFLSGTPFFAKIGVSFLF